MTSRTYSPVIALALLVLTVAAWCIYAELREGNTIAAHVADLDRREIVMELRAEVAKRDSVIIMQNVVLGMAHDRQEARYAERVAAEKRAGVYVIVQRRVDAEGR